MQTFTLCWSQIFKISSNFECNNGSPLTCNYIDSAGGGGTTNLIYTMAETTLMGNTVINSATLGAKKNKITYKITDIVELIEKTAL